MWLLKRQNLMTLQYYNNKQIYNFKNKIKLFDAFYNIVVEPQGKLALCISIIFIQN